MSKAQSLVNKLKRRKKSANPGRGFRSIDKADLKDEVLADSPKAQKYLRGLQRRLDESFGQQLLASPNKTPIEVLSIVDLVANFGAAEVTFSGTELADSGVQVGDFITMLQGDLKGVQLAVISIDSATQVTIETPTFPWMGGTDLAAKVQISGTKSSYN